jgi:hypothetical protein
LQRSTSAHPPEKPGDVRIDLVGEEVATCRERKELAQPRANDQCSKPPDAKLAGLAAREDEKPDYGHRRLRSVNQWP